MYKDKDGDEWLFEEDYIKITELAEKNRESGKKGSREYWDRVKNGYKKLVEVEVEEK